MFLLEDTMQWCRWDSNLSVPSVSSHALYHWATALPYLENIICVAIFKFVCIWLWKIPPESAAPASPNECQYNIAEPSYSNIWNKSKQYINFWKQFGSRSGPTDCQTWSGSSVLPRNFRMSHHRDISKNSGTQSKKIMGTFVWSYFKFGPVGHLKKRFTYNAPRQRPVTKTHLEPMAQMS